jgi:hypothetical protein
VRLLELGLDFILILVVFEDPWNEDEVSSVLDGVGERKEKLPSDFSSYTLVLRILTAIG